jgi:hypothetical protein
MTKEQHLINIKITHKADADRYYNKPHCYYDVDETIIKWPDHPFQPSKGSVELMILGKSYYLIPHKKNIDKLKELYDNGYKIVVWSKGGEMWAKMVVQTLKLNQYVSCVHSKPDCYLDDVEPKEWMGENLWVKDE